MADNPITPGGAIPPRPSEAPKVQPRKETVRINLPPKPTAGAGASSATIKLPTMPAATPPAPFTAAAAPPPSVAVPPPPSAPKAPMPPAAPGARVAAPPSRAAASSPAIPAAAAAAPGAKRPTAPVAATKTVSGLDKGLAIAAMVASLAALGTVIYLGYVFSTHPGV